MTNKLKNGMRFKNMIELCNYIGWKYDYKHSARLSDKLRQYVDFHRENRNIVVIDNVFNENIEMVQFKPKRTGYDYEIGNIINVNNGKVEILEQTIILNKSNKPRKAYKARCLKCGYEYTDYDYNFYRGIGCGCCNGKVVVKGINDMATTNPDIEQFLLDKQDGYKYTAMSGRKIDFKCPICGAIYRQKAINNVAMRGLNCVCSGSKSYPNRFMYWLLTDLDVVFKDEMVFDWAKNKRYDFYIPSNKTIIEMNGNHHYNECYNFTRQTLQYQIDNDNLKRELAYTNGIVNYLQIKASKSEFEYIKEQVMNSELSNVYDLSDVNWENIELKCETNVLIKIAELWNDGMRDSKEIGDIVGLSSSSVTKFLHKCEKFELIDEYDKKAINKLRLEKVNVGIYQNQTTPIKCNENDLVFGSLSLAKNKMQEITGMKFSHSNMLGTITGRYSHHHHFTFSHITKQQFNEIKRTTPEKAFGDFFILEDSKSA